MKKSWFRYERSAWSSKATVLVLLGGLSIAASALATLTFTGQTFAAGAPPNPTISSGPANPTNQTSASFTFSSSGATGYLCQLDGSAFTACSSPKSYLGPLAAGTHQFRVEATNGSGTSGATSWNWSIDLTPPPAPQITTSPADPTSSTSASFAFKDSEAGVTFLCSLDGAPFTTCTTPVSYSGLGEGSHSFQVEAKDKAGNVSAPASDSWTVDLTPPAAPSITAFPPAQTLSTSATFSFTGEAGATFLCSLDGAAFAACTSPKAYSNLASGTHTFQVEAKDAAGNVGPAASYTWFVGPTTPTIASFPANPSNSSSATFAFTSPDSGVSFLCKLDGAAFAACTSPKTYTGLSDGSHTFQVEGKVGTSTGQPASYTWVVDTKAPPAPSITSKPANPTNNASPSFAFTDTESGVSFLCKLDAGSFSVCSSPQSYSGLADGSHTFQVEAKDAAGNISTATSYTWTVDTQPPLAPALTSFPPDPSTSSTATFAFSGFESGLTYSCLLDLSNLTSPCTSPITYKNLIDGSHTFQVIATDAAGNQSSPTSYTWTIDTVPPPAPAITGSPSNPTFQTSASFTFNDSEAGVSFLCQLDGGSFTACTSPQNYPGPLSVGSHSFQAEAKDAAGNVSTAASFTWQIQPTPPPSAPTITSGPPNPTYQTSATFTYGEQLGSPVSIGPATMEGNLEGTAGDWVSVGYHFKYSSSHPASTVSFYQPQFTFAVKCSDGTTPSQPTWTITAPDATYSVAANDTGYQPWTSQQVAASFQAAAQLPATLCGTTPGNIDLDQGATFTAMLGSSDTTDAVQIQFHYRDPNAKGAGNINCSDPTQNPDPGLSAACGASVSATKSFTPGFDASAVSYVCSLDSGPFLPCGSGATATKTYPGPLAPGNHTFRVEAVVGSTTSSPATYTWTILQPLTVGGDTNAPLYPGGPTRSFATKITNPAGIPITVTSITMAKVTGSFPAGCSPSDFTLQQVDLSTATPTPGQITIPANGSVTLPAQGVAAPTITMADNANQDACKGATLQVSYAVTSNYSGSFTGTGKATVGTPTKFTVSLGPPSGGPLFPTAIDDPNRTVDTVQVTVTNNDPGAELLHQLTYQITPGWTATLAGHSNCTAADFSIDGQPVGQSHTVVYDDHLAPGANVTHSFTVQMVENGHNQSACVGAQVSLTAVAS
jgi:large repetitive protein